MSWFPGTASTGSPERAQKDGRLPVLVGVVAMRGVAARHDQLRLEFCHERSQPPSTASRPASWPPTWRSETWSRRPVTRVA